MATEPQFGRDKPKPLAKLRPRVLEPTPPADEITLRDLVLKLWRGKWIICASTGGVLALVVLWMKLTDPLYTASIVIAPASESGAGGLAGKLSRYSGLASLAGIDLPGEESVSPFIELMEIATSPTVAERLLEEPELLQTIFENDWDAESESWVAPDGPVATVKGWVYGFFNQPGWTPPSATTLAEFLEEQLEISDVSATGMKRVEFHHKDPEFAVHLLRRVGLTSDDIIRKRALERTSREIAYIEDKLASVTRAEHRLSLVELLSEQEQRMMMIQIDLPYAARVIEPSRTSDTPTFPKPTLILALGIVGGGLLGILIVFLCDALRRDGLLALPQSFDKKAAGESDQRGVVR